MTRPADCTCTPDPFGRRLVQCDPCRARYYRWRAALNDRVARAQRGNGSSWGHEDAAHTPGGDLDYRAAAERLERRAIRPE